MHIVTASDRNYIPGVFVLIASARRHNPGSRFTVLAVEWNETDLERLAALATHLGTVISAIPLESNMFVGLDVGRKHHTSAMYARLLIPDLLPYEDRVLYMDCDMVVTGSLEKAWEVNLDGLFAAAVPCPSPLPEAIMALQIESHDYVNSGFLVMNLALWRDEETASICLKALSDTPEKFPSQDEAAINYFCHGRIYYLPCTYNIYAIDFVYEKQPCQPEDIKVLHFIMGKKPWIRESPYSSVWYHEAAKVSQVIGIPSDPPRANLREKLRLANRQRKLWQARISGGERHQRYLRHLRFMDWVTRHDTST